MQDEQNVTENAGQQVYEQNLAENVGEQVCEQEDNNICKGCGRFDIDRSENPNSILCSACRETYIHYPIPKNLILVFIITALLLGAAFYRFPKVLESYRIYKGSEQMVRNGEISTAINGLYTVIERYPNATSVAVRFTDIAMEGGRYDVASDVISTYLANRELSEDEVTRINQYIDILERYYNTFNAVEDMESQLDTSLSPEEAMNKMSEQLRERLTLPDQDKSVLYYCLFMYSQDMNEGMGYLEKCIEEDDTFFEAKVQLASLVRRQGNLDQAEGYYNEVLSVDKYNSAALRGLAIIRLLEDNKEEGLDLADRAYNLDPEGTYIWDTYVIALKENDKDNAADELIQEYLSKNNELDTDLQEYISGNLTLEDYYIGNKEVE